MLVYARFKNAYLVCKKAYAKQLLLSNTISTMMLNGFGDIFCQFIEYKLAKNKNVDDYAKNSENSSIVQTERPSFFNVYSLNRTGNLTLFF